MRKITLSLLALILATFVFGQKFPFPMNEQSYKYPYGIVAENPCNEQIQEIFLRWDKTMYRESADGQFGRIRFDSEAYTVSEGIGYGMLIYVYMANETNDFCQDRFDKLYAYYKKWSDSYGLMHWKINGFTSVESYNAATDADLDVALALCLAAKQWGYSSSYSYADEAEILLDNIYKKEVGTHEVNGKLLTLFNPGDSWSSTANACYFTVASVGVYKQTQEYFSFAIQHDWQTVYDDCHTFLELSQKNGVWANWNNWDGSLIDRSPYDLTSMDCGWDACRVPWRVGWDYLWFGSESSKRMMAKTIEMLTARELLEKPGKAGGFSNLDGESYSDLTTTAGSGSSAFMGAYACALATDETQQAYLNGFHERLLTRDESPYYSPTLQVLYLLATSGNAANFYALDDCAPQIIVNPVLTSAETDGEMIVVSCSKMMSESTIDFSGFSLNVNGQVVADAFTLMMISEKNIYLGLKENSVLANNAVILSYSGDQLESTQGGKLQPALAIPVLNHVFEVGGNTNLSDCETENTLLGGRWYSYSDGSKQSYKVVESGANGTEHSIYFEFTDIKSYAGTGFNILNGESPLDCSGSTGFSFYHKGDACILEAKTVTKRNAGYSYQTYDIEAHEEWTKIELTWEDVADDFITSGYVTEVTGFQWKEVTGSGTFYIDEVVLIGRTISPSETDRNQLTTTLISANSLYANATTEKYSQAAIDKFATEIQSAASEYLNTQATFAELDSTNTALNAAISAFQSSSYGDKKVLDKAIKAAQLVSSEAIIGTAKGNYPQTAKDELDAAIAEAQNAYDTFGLTTSEISQAVSTLEKAVKKFKAAVIKTAIESVSVEVSIYPSPCVSEIFVEGNDEISYIELVGINGMRTKIAVNQSNATIPMNDFPTGIYTLRIVFVDGKISLSQIVKK